MTYAELKILFANKYEQTSSTTTSADIKNRFINLACKNITRRFKWSWRRKPGSGTTDGTKFFSFAIDLGTDGIVKDSFFIGGVLFTEIQESERAFITADSQVIFITGNKRDGYKAYFPCAIPESGQAVEYFYYMEHPDLTLDADITIIPDGEAIVDLAIGKYFKSEEENEQALTFLEDAENSIDDMKRAEQRNKPTKRIRKRGANYHDIKNCY